MLGFTYVLTLAGPSHQVFQVSCSMCLNVVHPPLVQGVRAALLSTQGAVVTLPYCFLNTEVNTVVGTRS